MRAANTYRRARRAAVKERGDEWRTAPENNARGTYGYQPAVPSASKYPPHQGAKQRARYANA